MQLDEKGNIVGGFERKICKNINFSEIVFYRLNKIYVHCTCTYNILCCFVQFNLNEICWICNVFVHIHILINRYQIFRFKYVNIFVEKALLVKKLFLFLIERALCYYEFYYKFISFSKMQYWIRLYIYYIYIVQRIHI